MGKGYVENYRIGLSILTTMTFRKPSTETGEPTFKAEPDFDLKGITMGKSNTKSKEVELFLGISMSGFPVSSSGITISFNYRFMSFCININVLVI